MASLHEQADAVRSAVASISTCTATTSATLKELLIGKEPEATETNTTTTSRARKPTQVTKGKAAVKTQRGAQAAVQTAKDDNGKREGLSPKEKAVLATQVVNASLKALGEAAKAPIASASVPKSPAKAQLAKSGSRNALRRSNSMPMTPLQPRSLNRTSTSPLNTTRTCRTPAAAPVSTGCLAAVECARVAFSTMRALQNGGKIQLPELQLETGMSSFVSKLLALNMFDQAAKELRLLKKRLETMATTSCPKGSKQASSSDSNSSPKALSDLFDYSGIVASGPLLNLIVSSQLQALRILRGLKKTSHLNAALAFLRTSCSTSPLSLLLASLKDKKTDRAKCARQLDSLSQLLLSLTPSIASKDDDIAAEPRLSPSPEVALEVQTTGLITRLQAWRLSGHKADVDKEIMLPLAGCLSAFARRSSSDAKSKSHSSLSAFSAIEEMLSTNNFKPTETSKSPIAGIYQILGTLCRDAGDFKEAQKWMIKLNGIIDTKEDSAARCYSVTAHLLAISLKLSSQVDVSLVREILTGMEGSLNGSTTELDDLLVGLCLARKAAVAHVLDTKRSETSGSKSELDSFVLRLPRFALRWLGKPPSTAGSTKDFVRFEQRRQLLLKYVQHILDSALMLLKMLLEQNQLEWDAMDPVLQDSLLLLENIGDMSWPDRNSSSSVSYHVKISHLYYQNHVKARQASNKGGEATALRSLRRSVDAVKQRPEADQEKAQLMVKLERLAGLCRALGRREDAVDTLRSMRDVLVREDVVTRITRALSTQQLISAWRLDAKAEALSSTVGNLAKLERQAVDWTWLLVGVDKATAMEHDLHHIVANDPKLHQQAKLSDPAITSLLQIYSNESHPIRRTRVLLQLLIINMNSSEEITDLREEVRMSMDAANSSNLGEDTGLAGFLTHFKALETCTLGLIDSIPDTLAITQALDSWKALVDNCQSAKQILECIDNPPQLLLILQSLSDFSRMKGLNVILRSCLELAASLSQKMGEDDPDIAINQTTALCLQYLALGQSSRASEVLKTSQQYIEHKALSPESAVKFQLCSAEYNAAVGNYTMVERNLVDADAAFMIFSEQNPKRLRHLSTKLMVAQAGFLHSMLALHRGNSHYALHHVRNAVRQLFHDWTKMESVRSSVSETSDEESSRGEVSEEDTSFENSAVAKSETLETCGGPDFWAMVCPLFRFTMWLSSTYAHAGMYQETVYYAEQAQKIAKSTASSSFSIQADAWLASIWHRAGKVDDAMKLAAEIAPAVCKLEPTVSAVTTICQLSRILQSDEGGLAEHAFFETADEMIRTMGAGVSSTMECSLATEMAKLTVEEPSTTKRSARTAKPAKTTKTSVKPTSKKTVPKTAPSLVDPTPLETIGNIQISLLQSSVLEHESLNSLSRNDWAAALSTLKRASELVSKSAERPQGSFLMALALIGQSLELMGKDSVFSVIQDSTLSFPAVASALKEKTAAVRTSTKTTPPQKGSSRALEPQNFVGMLLQAHERLIDAHSLASLNGEGQLVHRIASLLQSVSILLSTTSPSSLASLGHPAHATCSVELARNLMWRREKKTLQIDSASQPKSEWPILLQSPDARRSSLGFSIDMNRFQQDYIDIIPKSWNVVSVSLSEGRHELCLTKLQAGHSPFAIRLPLERASSRDADSEVFSFDQGRSELLEIIEHANRTCHDARDMTAKGAKSAWWAEREALDERMRSLLENIEQTWLGGFRGIFAQHHRRSDLLARFQKTFQNVLDKHLPSRRQVRGKKAKAMPGPKIALDPRILDLFIELGDASVPDCDLDEQLMDLLYFVVDVLQFHGEHNAYDEVDFDAMVVDTFDALHAYHAAAKSSHEATEGIHTILLLDKQLHSFPLESLPCMQGLSVSRMPSLACLRRSILEQRSPQAAEAGMDELTGTHQLREGHYASFDSGTYILNPSVDLKNTEATFGKALARLPPSWTSIETRAPSEAEFEKSLTSSDLMLYFGHGSGAQYIRGRTIRKLEKCRAVALLMGCSSASLAEVGDFECHGPVWNYMLAGSPAVVGTLWDVTDRDIDRFAGRMFEEWGLMPKGTFAEEKEKGKGKASAKAAKKKVDVESEASAPAQTSLVEAIARARAACRFKYLTAAAVCIYGIPVYIDQ